jgi:hypothetical protein
VRSRVDARLIVSEWYSTRTVIPFATCRPSYCELASLRGVLVEQIVACTATADRSTLAEIQRCLGLQTCVVVCMPIAKPNASIFLTRKHVKAAEGNLVRTLQRSNAQQVLLFCRKRSETERMASVLQMNAITASAYHSAVPDRSSVMQDFVSGTIRQRCRTVSGFCHTHMHATSCATSCVMPHHVPPHVSCLYVSCHYVQLGTSSQAIQHVKPSRYMRRFCSRCLCHNSFRNGHGSALCCTGDPLGRGRFHA